MSLDALDFAKLSSIAGGVNELVQQNKDVVPGPVYRELVRRYDELDATFDELHAVNEHNRAAVESITRNRDDFLKYAERLECEIDVLKQKLAAFSRNHG